MPYLAKARAHFFNYEPALVKVEGSNLDNSSSLVFDIHICSYTYANTILSYENSSHFVKPYLLLFFFEMYV